MSRRRLRIAANADISPTRILVLNTAAFTVCFAVWMLYGTLIKFLSGAGLYAFSAQQMGLLLAAPVLTGALLRLPVGVLADRYGGRPVFTGVLLVSAAGVLTVSLADSFWGFFCAGLCFGVAGASFAVGVAFTSVWFEKSRQGTALGVFGAGNAGAAVTLLLGPQVLERLTAGGQSLGQWRLFPLIYAAVLVLMAASFWTLSVNRFPDAASQRGLRQRLAPLARLRVWRFGLYYVLLFGCFVGLSGWLVNYYVDVYGVSLAVAGWLAAAFSLPSSVVRAAGGWLSDRLGARTIMFWVLSVCLVGALLACAPMGIAAFTVLVILIGIAMGIGMAAVYKHIPAYYPQEVGVVGGMVGVLGGLGGFFCPIVFGFLLSQTQSSQHPAGLWSTSWMFIAGIAAISLLWMSLTVLQLKADTVRLSSVPAE